jgi:pSer/pThr/pTyr-binding forkhead associated (FHA) protein
MTFRGRAWYVEDRGSTNGTWVNGHRITRPVALSYGDELAVGRVRFRLER